MGTMHTVCKVTDLPEGESGAVTIGDKTIAVFCIGGRYFAIDDTCPHMGGSLSAGVVQDGIVTCPWHFWRFRLADGAWADNPRIKIGCYPVHIVGDEVRIEVPDRTAGSGSPLPTCS
jgi:nitrite reductase (NADH) small subunit